MPEETRERPGVIRHRVAAEKRGWILEAAEKLFAEHGYLKTSVDQIAAEACVSKGLVYVHFDSKEALLVAVLERAIAAWNEATTERARCAGGTVCQMIVTAIEASIEYARHNAVLRAILRQDPRVLLPRQTGGHPPHVQAYLKDVQCMLEHGIATGEIRPDVDVPRMAEAIWIIHDGLVDRLFVEGEETANDAALVRAATDMIVRGIEVQREPTGD